MNLAKTALYLEYIAFNLRFNFSPETIGEPMSKQKTDNAGAGSGQTLPLDSRFIPPEQATAGRPPEATIKATLPEAPAEPTPAKAPPRTLNPELQASAAIDRILRKMDLRTACRVLRHTSERYIAAQNDEMHAAERADPCL